MVAPIYGIVRIREMANRHKKSPLNIDLLRSPGQTLKEKIEDLSDEIMINLMSIPILFLTVTGAILWDKTFSVKPINTSGIVIVVVFGVAASIYLVTKGYKYFKEHSHLRLGYECEQAVGQDLNNLIAHGFKVYHDFPADGFNIDHIAIGPQGVFAIETKGRSKQLNLNKPNWKLEFDGMSLKFPTWIESQPVDQAKRQAKWLSKWLESATGEPQHVVPVLAVPGWYIERKVPSKLIVYAGKGSHFLAKGNVALSENKIKTLSHQIEGKCRDVKVRSYQKN